MLERAGIVDSNRIGRESQFTFAPESIKQASTYLNTVSAQWDDALLRLRKFVE